GRSATTPHPPPRIGAGAARISRPPPPPEICFQCWMGSPTAATPRSGLSSLSSQACRKSSISPDRTALKIASRMSSTGAGRPSVPYLTSGAGAGADGCFFVAPDLVADLEPDMAPAGSEEPGESQPSQ